MESWNKTTIWKEVNDKSITDNFMTTGSCLSACIKYHLHHLNLSLHLSLSSVLMIYKFEAVIAVE